MDLPGGLSQLLFPLAPPRLPSTSAPASSSSAQPAAPSLEARLPGTVHLYSNGLRGEKLQLAWMREQVRVRSLAPESRATMEVKQRWRGVRCHPSVQSMHWNPQPNSLVISSYTPTLALYISNMQWRILAACVIGILTRVRTTPPTTTCTPASPRDPEAASHRPPLRGRQPRPSTVCRLWSSFPRRPSGARGP